MKIEINSLTLTNFKGIRQLQINFGQQTDISGDNATGKTTIFDSFLWLLFGKDSSDRKDFMVKTLDKYGEIIPMIEHEVIGKLAIWDADDNELPRILILRRVFREKWVKPRGQAESRFEGNETVYYVDSVPCTMKEYNEKIDSICKESLFKLLTNPAYFPSLNWTTQRQTLFTLIPDITNDDIIAAVSDKEMKQGKFSQLLKVLNAQKTLENYRKEIANDIRRLKDELVLIPARIDEVLRGTPEPEDWDALEKGIKEAEAFILRKEEERTNKLSSVESESKKRADRQAKINSIKQQMTTIKYATEDALKEKTREAQNRKAEHDRYISDYNDLISKTNKSLSAYRLEMEELSSERAKLLEEWRAINSQVYDLEDRKTCPVCKQELPADQIAGSREEAMVRFNKEKAFALEQNKKKGTNVASQITLKQGQIAEATAKIEKLKSDLEAVRSGWEGEDDPKSVAIIILPVDEMLLANEEYMKLRDEFNKETAALEKLGPIKAVDTSTIDKEITFARSALDQKKTLLGKREQINKATDRKIDLEIAQKGLSQEIANLEQMEFTIETFIRTKVNLLEQKINSMFSYVKFKMFNLQINGMLEETCECSINGVPYSDLNNAARINAGIDIINTMSRKYGIIAPIWIDNRESVNQIIPTKAQLISLYVTNDKSLVINH